MMFILDTIFGLILGVFFIMFLFGLILITAALIGIVWIIWKLIKRVNVK